MGRVCGLTSNDSSTIVGAIMARISGVLPGHEI